jgi:hypothetical protein
MHSLSDWHIWYPVTADFDNLFFVFELGHAWGMNVDGRGLPLLRFLIKHTGSKGVKRSSDYILG